jgi:hypothetical protein
MDIRQQRKILPACVEQSKLILQPKSLDNRIWDERWAVAQVSEFLLENYIILTLGLFRDEND